MDQETRIVNFKYANKTILCCHSEWILHDEVIVDRRPRSFLTIYHFIPLQNEWPQGIQVTELTVVGCPRFDHQIPYQFPQSLRLIE